MKPTRENGVFYRLPKALFAQGPYEGLTLEAKALYAMLLDRADLSAENGWRELDGRVFLYFTLEEARRLLGRGRNKTAAAMRELEDAGLIFRKRQGQGKPAKIYVTPPLLPEAEDASEEAPAMSPETEEQMTEKRESRLPETGDQDFPPEDAGHAEERNETGRAPKREAVESPETEEQMTEKRESGLPETGGQDFPLEGANHTERSYTEKNQTEIIQTEKNQLKKIQSDSNKINPSICPIAPSRQGPNTDEMDEIKKTIQENIEYDTLIQEHPEDKGVFDNYIELIAETCFERLGIRFHGRYIPPAAARKRLMKLNREHVLYVRDCLRESAGPIKNIRAYILAALFNAPATMDQYYDSLVSRDFPEG